MKAQIYNLEGKSQAQIDLSEKIFGIAFNMPLVHQAVVAERANLRKPSAHSKTRGEVRGGGKKPWRQKGTGRARAGSIRSPIWRGGGVTFGPRAERNFKQAFNRSQFRKALFSTLSQQLAEKRLFIIEDLKAEKIKTREALSQLKALSAALGLASQKFNLVIPGTDKFLQYSLRNVPGIGVLRASEITPYTLLKWPVTLVFKSAVPVIEKTYLKN